VRFVKEKDWRRESVRRRGKKRGSLRDGADLSVGGRDRVHSLEEGETPRRAGPEKKKKRRMTISDRRRGGWRKGEPAEAPLSGLKKGTRALALAWLEEIKEREGYLGRRGAGKLQELQGEKRCSCPSLKGKEKKGKEVTVVLFRQRE